LYAKSGKIGEHLNIKKGKATKSAEKAIAAPSGYMIIPRDKNESPPAELFQAVVSCVADQAFEGDEAFEGEWKTFEDKLKIFGDKRNKLSRFTSGRSVRGGEAAEALLSFGVDVSSDRLGQRRFKADCSSCRAAPWIPFFRTSAVVPTTRHTNSGPT
jgi:hypothetical protein